MADSLRSQQQYQLLKSKHIGVGDATNTTKEEWITNIKRDTYASMVSHSPLLEYYSVASGKPQKLAQLELIEKMVKPYGKTINLEP